MPGLVLRYDLRSAPFGAPHAELYAAMLDQCAWAEEHGLDAINISEHHGTDDGYCPSPLVLAAAIGARTRRIRILVAAAVLPLHDPIRFAEDAAVADLATGGRLDLVLVPGYRPAEFAMFGRPTQRRISALERGVAALKQAWTGEPFEYEGRPVRVTPRPAQRPHPPLLLGGGAAVGRLAARSADGYLPAMPDPALFAAYTDERDRLGAGPGALLKPTGLMGVHVCADADEGWRDVGPHFLHEARAYGAWENERPGANGVPLVSDIAGLRSYGGYQVVDPAGCLALWQGLPADAALILHPLAGGLDPKLGWSSLELFGREVLPKLDRSRGLR